MTAGISVLVSAIVSTFNSARFLAGCLQDLEDQSLSARTEIIVVDSGSEQGERGIVAEFQGRYANIRYMRTENREPVYAAWNRGIRAARGRYITNANTDDRHRHDAFARMVAELDARPEVALVYADVVKTRTENETFESCTPTGSYRWYDWDRSLLLTRGCFIGPQPMWRRSVHDRYGYFAEELVSSGDFEFWLRISQTLRFHHIREPLGLYLERPDSIEHRHQALKKAEDARILYAYRAAAAAGEIVLRLPGSSSDRALTYGGSGRNASAPLSETPRARADGPMVVFRHPDTDVSRNDLCIKSGQTERARQPFSGCPARSNATGRSPVYSATPSAERHTPGGKDMLPVEQVYEDMQPVLLASRPEHALQSLRNIVRSFPDFARAHSDLAELYYQSGEKHKALAHFERAVDIAPENPAFLKNLADYYHVEMGRAADAAGLYVKIAGLQPNAVEILQTTAHLLVGLERFEEAAGYYRRVLAIEPWNTDATANLQKLQRVGGRPAAGLRPEEMYAVVQRLVEQGNAPAARAQLEKILEFHPEFALAHNDLGVLCIQAGEPDKALRHYAEAVRLQPDNATFQKNLGDFYYIAQGRIEDALRVYVRILEAHPADVETLMATGHVCAALSRREDANHFYRRVLEIEPHHAEAKELLERMERLAAADPCGEHTASAQDLYAEAGRLIAAGNAAAGKDRLLQVAAAYPGFALAHNDLGVLTSQDGDLPAAIEHYRTAVRLEPANPTFLKNLADLLWAGFGRMEEALKLYVDVLKLYPGDLETLLATGKICLALHQPEDARAFFGRVLEIEPWNEVAYQELQKIDDMSRAA